MREYLAANESALRNQDSSRYLEEIRRALSQLRLTFDCVLVDPNDERSPEIVDFNWFLKTFQDWTGYEASCNEIYIEQADSLPFPVLEMASLLFSGLKERYPERTFCVVIGIDINEECGNSANVRFHTVRDHEPCWVDPSDIEAFSEPVFIEIG